MRARNRCHSGVDERDGVKKRSQCKDVRGTLIPIIPRHHARDLRRLDGPVESALFHGAPARECEAADAKADYDRLVSTGEGQICKHGKHEGNIDSRTRRKDGFVKTKERYSEHSTTVRTIIRWRNRRQGPLWR